MTAQLAHRAETLRLSRVLGVSAEELGFLADAPTLSLAELRNSISDRLLERSRREFERAIALADKVPRRLAATLAYRAMGPVLAGRAASLLSAELAADLAGRLPAEFLADVAGHVDLRHVGPLIGGIPADTMGATGRVLRDREEWIVLSAFVGHVPEAKLTTLLGLFDGEALLRSGFVVEDVSRLDAVMALLPDGRIDELLLAAHEHRLWPEAMAVAGEIGPDQAERVVRALIRLPDDVLDALLTSAYTNDLWREALVVLGRGGTAGDEAIVAGIDRMPEAQIEALADVLKTDVDLREEAARLIKLAPDHLRRLLD